MTPHATGRQVPPSARLRGAGRQGMLPALMFVPMPWATAAISAKILETVSPDGSDALRLARVEGDAGSATDLPTRVPVASEDRLWRSCSLLAADDSLGLHVAERVERGDFGVVEFAFRCAPTLHVAIERFTRFAPLLHDSYLLSLSVSKEHARIEQLTSAPAHCRQSAEFMLALLLTWCLQCCEEAVRVLAVEFKHPPRTKKQTKAEFARVFGVEPQFAVTHNALVLPSSVLERGLRTADAALWRTLEPYGESLLASRSTFADNARIRVRRVLTTLLPSRGATLSRTARELKMSPRNLQRRLSAEGTSFDSVLEELRRELAFDYLRDVDVALSEIAARLGYAEVSPFHRAFRRWTGTTPSEARRQWIEEVRGPSADATSTSATQS